jgi:hypothetical protein
MPNARYCWQALRSVETNLIKESTSHSQFPIFAILTTLRNCDSLVRALSKKAHLHDRGAAGVCPNRCIPSSSPSVCRAVSSLCSHRGIL